ncbi:hypothetical protein TorRG33x02_301150 [Trema orientale]|uniref:Uncharacterized protein n=1 Tax=Trema orientale TaxID=63057 RepID=A0A2P5C1E4_TREOI|nr:hypothetical protein TorRG33x02_301150 [Trema orientale]
MKHTPLSFQCKDGCNGNLGTVLLAVSKSGVAYVWHLITLLEEDINPTKMQCKVNEGKNSKKIRATIIAARLHSLDANRRMKALVAFGSMDHPRFSLVDMSNPEEYIVINALDETSSILENGVARGMINFLCFCFSSHLYYCVFAIDIC